MRTVNCGISECNYTITIVTSPDHRLCLTAESDVIYRFMSHIISVTRLKPTSTFVDLGSGVANCVLQTSLQAGCKSLGVELLPVPAHCARLQVAEVKRRWAMWGLNGNLAVGVEEGDFRSGKVGGWLSQADVVVSGGDWMISFLSS